MLIRGMEMNSGFAPGRLRFQLLQSRRLSASVAIRGTKHRVPANRGRRQLTTLRGCHSIGLADDPSMLTGWDRSPREADVMMLGR